MFYSFFQNRVLAWVVVVGSLSNWCRVFDYRGYSSEFTEKTNLPIRLQSSLRVMQIQVCCLLPDLLNTHCRACQENQKEHSLCKCWCLKSIIRVSKHWCAMYIYLLFDRQTVTVDYRYFSSNRAASPCHDNLQVSVRKQNIEHIGKFYVSIDKLAAAKKNNLLERNVCVVYKMRVS